MTPRAVEWKLLLIIGKKPDYDDDRVPCNYDQQILEPSPLFCLDSSFLLLSPRISRRISSFMAAAESY
jgi:hypothetical protein